MKNLLAITAFIQCAIGVWVEWQFYRKYSRDERQDSCHNSITSTAKKEKWNECEKILFYFFFFFLLSCGMAAKALCMPKRNNWNYFLLTHFFYGFSIPLNVPQETISIQSISYCHSDDFWWCWASRRFFNPFYMRKFLEKWKLKKNSVNI